MNSDDYLTVARSLVGTPFHKRARIAGVGVDCVGVVILVGEACGETFEDAREYKFGYEDNRLLDALRDQLVPIAVEDARPGDVLAFFLENRRIVRHVAILSDVDRRIIHAHMDNKKVVEGVMGRFWSRRLHSAYRYPGIAHSRGVG